MKRKLHSNSFAARLTAGQRDELFAALAGGLSYTDAVGKVHEWLKANAAADLNGGRRRREIKPPCRSSIGGWYQATAVQQRYEVAKQVALAAQAHCPADYDEQARRALGQAKFLATLEGLRVSDIATLERNEIAREKLALEREKLDLNAHKQYCEDLFNRSLALVRRAEGGEKSGDLRLQIKLALEEIEKMKRGEV